MSPLTRRLQRQLGEKYEIGRLIGTGGMGEVWAAHDTELDCQVAIKVLSEELSRDEEFEERFRREMKTLAKFSHPRIVHIKAAGRLKLDERLYMVMELVRGKTLRLMLDEAKKSGAPLDWVSAGLYAHQMVEGLAVAHKLGIVHRDIKPENMIVNAKGDLTLLDFGLARAIEATGPQPEPAAGRGRVLTKSSTLVGTPRYMAPELIEHRTFDARSDLYGVGIVTSMMLTGEYPYDVDASDERAILAAHVEKEPVLRREVNPECPEELWALALKLLAKKPDERYQSAAEVKEELSALLRGSVPPAHPLARRVREQREQEALRKVYEERGAPSRKRRAATSVPDVTKPLGEDYLPQSPCAQPAQAAMVDRTIPIQQAPRASTETQAMPVKRLPTGMPVWLSERRPQPVVPAVSMAQAPVPERHRLLRRSTVTLGVLAAIVLGTLLGWTLLGVVRPMRPAPPPSVTAAATASVVIPAVVTVEPNATAAPSATAASTTAAPTKTARPIPPRPASPPPLPF